MPTICLDKRNNIWSPNRGTEILDRTNWIQIIWAKYIWGMKKGTIQHFDVDLGLVPSVDPWPVDPGANQNVEKL